MFPPLGLFLGVQRGGEVADDVLERPARTVRSEERGRERVGRARGEIDVARKE